MLELSWSKITSAFLFILSLRKQTCCMRQTIVLRVLEGEEVEGWLATPE